MKITKIIVSITGFLLFFFIKIASAECIISTHWDTEYALKILERSGGLRINNYEQLCEKINKANAKLFITTAGIESEGVYSSHITITLADKNINIFSDLQTGSSTINLWKYRGKTPDQLTVMAINQAVDSFNNRVDQQGNLLIDEAIKSLNISRQKAKHFFQNNK